MYEFNKKSRSPKAGTAPPSTSGGAPASVRGRALRGRGTKGQPKGVRRALKVLGAGTLGPHL